MIKNHENAPTVIEMLTAGATPRQVLHADTDEEAGVLIGKDWPGVVIENTQTGRWPIMFEAFTKLH